MEDERITRLEEALLGIALCGAIAGVPLDVMRRHFYRDGRPRASAKSPGYACLLREAADDIKAAAIDVCRVPPEVVDAWGPIGIDDALVAAERLKERARDQRDSDRESG